MMSNFMFVLCMCICYAALLLLGYVIGSGDISKIKDICTQQNGFIVEQPRGKKVCMQLKPEPKELFVVKEAKQ